MKKTLYLIALPLLVLSCSNDSDTENMDDVMELPVANFSANVTAIMTGEAVQFQSTSEHAESLLWSFPGGDPESSSASNPTVIYFNPGNFSVTLLAINAAGNDSASKSDYIEVTQPAEQFATYTVTFTGNWSAATHPTDFPTNADHFSSAVGMVHRDGAILFEEGDLASQGIEEMAESGSNGTLESEVGDMISAGMARSYFSGGGLSTGMSERTFEIEVSSEFPLVSVVSMIAPSPDWYVAAENVELFTNSVFVETVMLEGLSYDSGTDSGSTFTSSNDDTDPAENIARIISAPLGNGTTVDPPMVYFTFTKQ